MPELKDILVPAVVAAIVGALASLLAPWAHWGVEKLRARLENRKRLIATWRQALEGDFDRSAFRESPSYASLRPFLTPETIRFIENDNQALFTVGSSMNPLKKDLLKAVSEMERKWQLV